MIRDNYLKLLLVPSIGIVIPFLGRLINYRLYSLLGLFLAYLYFIIASLIIWQGCVQIHSCIRKKYYATDNPYHKMIRLYLFNSLYACIIFSGFTLFWFRISRDHFNWLSFGAASVLNLLITNIITMLYEVLYLSKEREIDVKVVDELDKERITAELEALRNQMDPHFLYNSLSTLSQLIVTNPSEANVFNHKLAKVYRSYLINKDNDIVTLSEEIELLNDYLFLLEIRYPACIHLSYENMKGKQHLFYVPPGALQCLCENAVKHNTVSREHPLNITVSIIDGCLYVLNNIYKEKKHVSSSSGSGLKNLNSRYLILCGQSIQINDANQVFSVKLPLILNS